MADQPEPKKETVRITLPPRPAGQPAPPSSTGRDTVRINMPARPPANGTVPRPPASTGVPSARPPVYQAPVPPAPSKAIPPPPSFRKPPTPPAGATSSPTAGTPPLMPKPAVPPPRVAASSASVAGPRKETARIALLPDPPPRPRSSVEMKKTQPLIATPEPVAPSAPVLVNVAPATTAEPFLNDIPMSFCWALLATSAAILLIQIWNYVS